MATNITNDQILPGTTGMGTISASLTNSHVPFFNTTKIKPLSSLGIDGDLIVYGDEATYYFVKSIGVIYGLVSSNSTCDTLQDGWQWKWNLGNNILTVKDSTNKTVAIRQIDTWADLNVSYDVLQSHQFIYYKGADAYNEDFIIVSKSLTNRISDKNIISWGWLDKYLTAAFHTAYGRLCQYMNNNIDTLSYDIDYIYDSFSELKTDITTVVTDLSMSGYFDFRLWISNPSVPADRLKKARKTILEDIGKILMIQIISSCLLAGSKPCFEPWMIWQMFKWLPLNAFAEIEDKIFDLSPWWGE